MEPINNNTLLYVLYNAIYIMCNPKELKQDPNYDSRKLILRYVSINVEYMVYIASFWHFQN